MARSTHAHYTAADRYERAANRHPRPYASKRAAILESIEAA